MRHLARSGTFGGQSDGRAWAEGGRALIVTGRGVSPRALDRFVRALRSAGPGEREQLRSRVLDASSAMVIEQCATRGEPLVAVGRRESGFRWAVGFGVGGQSQFSHCDVVLTASGPGSLGSAGGPRPAAGSISVATFGVGGQEPDGLFVVGVAPPRTKRVDAVLADRRVIKAELADEGPDAGQRYYATFIQGDTRSKPTLIARDNSGAELSRVTVGAQP